jgi:hypothetical protein
MQRSRFGLPRSPNPYIHFKGITGELVLFKFLMETNSYRVHGTQRCVYGSSKWILELVKKKLIPDNNKKKKKKRSLFIC